MGESIPTDTCLSPVSLVIAEHATAAQIAEWEEIYGTKRRQIYRWITRGRAQSDPCPLAHPELMPKWWSRNRPDVSRLARRFDQRQARLCCSRGAARLAARQRRPRH